MKTVHYVATLQLKRVEVEDGTNRLSPGHAGPIPSRRVGDVISLTVKGSSLDDLKSQLKDHLLIVTDDLSIPLEDSSSKGNMR